MAQNNSLCPQRRLLLLIKRDDLPGLVFFLIFFALPAFAASYDRVIVFGDSLSDIGNNRWVDHYNSPDPKLKANIKLGAPITNTENGRPGKLWIQDLLQDSPLFAASNRQIRASSAVGRAEESIDYAWAGAITKKGFIDDAGYAQADCQQPGQGCDPGVLTQVDNYLHDSRGIVDAKALYIIWAGGNDLFNNVTLLRDIVMHPSHIVEDFESFSWRPAGNLATVAAWLVKAGVPSAHIVVINLPNAAKTPAAQVVLKGHPWLEKLAQWAVESFNQHVADQINSYNAKHRANIQRIDVYPLFQEVLSDPKTYGFTNVAGRCLADPLALQHDCRGYLFYNYKHPTTQAGKVIATYISHQIKG